MYGMPQPANYGQYGFGGYAGFPGQAPAAPGSTGPGSPGMPQAANPGSTGLGLSVGGQQPGTETAAAQPGQPQWGATDPNYYSNYWGGELFLIVFLLLVLSKSLSGYYGQQAAQQQPGDAQMQGPA